MSTVNEILLYVSSDYSYGEDTDLSHDKALVAILNERLAESSIKVMTPFFCLGEYLNDRADFVDDFLFFGVVKNFDAEDFRKILKQVPWMFPEQVQVIAKYEGVEDRYELVETLLMNEIPQEEPLLYNPATGVRFGEEGAPQNVQDHAQTLREADQVGAWLFNPWTGELRDSFDVLEDPFGRQIDPPVDLTNLKPPVIDNGVYFDDHLGQGEVNVGIVVGKSEKQYYGCLNVRDLDPNLSYEEAVEFLLTKDNPDRRPICIHPEPVWWKQVNVKH